MKSLAGQEIAHRLLGTCDSVAGVLESLGLEGQMEEDEVEALVAENGVDVCALCGWWFEIGELDEDYLCYDCRESDEDD